MDNATQTRLIKNMRATRARQLSRASVHSDGDYPKFEPGMTTRSYLALFGIRCAGTMLDFGPIKYTKHNGYQTDLSAYDRPAPFLTPEQDLVIVETETEDCEVLW